MTGGGLALDGTRWVRSRRRQLLPVRVLGQLFRGKFLAGLAREYTAGHLHLGGAGTDLATPHAFAQFRRALTRQDWVVYAKRPFAGPRQVFRYLGRYTHRVGLSNQRLLAADDTGSASPPNTAAPCASLPTSSSGASSATSCPPASSRFATWACSRQAAPASPLGREPATSCASPRRPPRPPSARIGPRSSRGSPAAIPGAAPAVLTGPSSATRCRPTAWPTVRRHDRPVDPIVPLAAPRAVAPLRPGPAPSLLRPPARPGCRRIPSHATGPSARHPAHHGWSRTRDDRPRRGFLPIASRATTRPSSTPVFRSRRSMIGSALACAHARAAAENGYLFRELRRIVVPTVPGTRTTRTRRGRGDRRPPCPAARR